MKLSIIRRILKEDLARAGGETPKWLDSLLSTLNDFIEQVGRALQNRLTFEDNFQCVIKSIDVVNGTEKEVSTGSALRVTGVTVLDLSGKKLTGFKWERKTTGTLGITADFTPTGTTTCKLLILLGE